MVGNVARTPNEQNRNIFSSFLNAAGTTSTVVKRGYNRFSVVSSGMFCCSFEICPSSMIYVMDCSNWILLIFLFVVF